MTRLNIPEIIQSSAMDCGPAVLAALLQGFGLPVSFPRLREACQTDVDGTSIDTLEVLANRLGLCADQIMLPSEFVLRKSSINLPCIAVVNLPNGLTHFVVVWRELLGFVQVMDPGRGRSWMRKARFLETLYQHELPIDPYDWLAYAQSDEFTNTIHELLDGLGIASHEAELLLAGASEKNTWASYAQLDAAIRMCRTLQSKIRPNTSLPLLNALLECPELISENFYQVRAESQNVILKGAILIRISGLQAGGRTRDPIVETTQEVVFQIPILKQFRQLSHEADLTRVMLGLCTVSLLVALITIAEALIFRYLISVQLPTNLPDLALIACVILLPLSAALAFETGGVRLAQALGYQLDTNLQTRLLRKLPRMADGYFSSRLISDLAERGHAITQIREMPELIRRTFQVAFRILLLLLGLLWLLPDQGWLILVVAVISLLGPTLIFPTLAERDLRARTHLGALSRFYLDSLRGSEAIGAHGAAESLKNEQESLLLKWVQASKEALRPSTWFEFLQILVSGAISIVLVTDALQSPMSPGSTLLVAYWSLFLPILSRQLTKTLKQFPSLNNIARRVLEIITAPEEGVDSATATKRTLTTGVSLEFVSATVSRGEIPLIENVSAKIQPGEKVVIVGATGSGKSTFLGVVSGWHSLSRGNFLIDGESANPASIEELRAQTALISPDLYLWNRSLFENINYGLETTDANKLEYVLSATEITDDLPEMEDGLATVIGEDGSRLSGGESQRVRIARGLVRPGRRLVLLDEPFTGMDSNQRSRMRQRILKNWQHATMLFVSHNVTECSGFDRVLVFDNGQLIEDGHPDSLMSQPDSAYANLIAAEDQLQKYMKDTTGWKRLFLRDGEMVSK